MIEIKQIDENGKLGPIKDICETAAQRTMKDRWGKDTHPSIVQMVIDNKRIPHWYYRSDQWISQPYDISSYHLLPYIGSVEKAPAEMYGVGTYAIDDRATNFAMKRIKSGKL